MRIGVDTGGTFTDCVLFERSEIRIIKVFSTPDDPAQGILDGARRVASDSRGEAPIDIIHGTTVGTNSLLERRGARVALVTTAGFEDLIEIGRQNRPRLYDLDVRREPPLVPRPLRWGVRERTAADGKILLRPGSRELKHLLQAIRSSGAESIALCFLFSFRNPRNERFVARALRQLGLPLSVSHEILPEFREYERLSTVVINAFLAPRVGAYFARLGQTFSGGLRRESFGDSREDSGSSSAGANKTVQAPKALTRLRERGRIYVMQSSGGITSAERAAREPVRTILSGPAGGVVAAYRLAVACGVKRAISFDMGGTSTDVCLLDGPPRTTRETTLAGLPVAAPVLDVHSVGAGGGSLARLDAGGALRVGPESSGAVPGPICYGRGGTQPTVTDAHLLLGRLDPEHFLDGGFRLDVGAVEKHFLEFLRGLSPKLRKLGPPTPHALARGIIDVSTATMERALRLISVARGHDPRDFTLICFGGAGGLHAADLARSMGLAGVIVPRHPGAFSAVGILLSDIVKDVSQSVLLTVPVAPETGRRNSASLAKFRNLLQNLRRRFESIERAARAEFNRDYPARGQTRIERRLAVRYVGQAYENSLPFTPTFPRRFHAEHEKAHGYAQANRPLEVVSLQVRLTLPTPKPPSRLRTDANNQLMNDARSRDPQRAMVKPKPVWFGNKFWRTPFYGRDRLGRGMEITGPAIVVEYSSTTVVPPDFSCRVDEHLNLKLTQHAN